MRRWLRLDRLSISARLLALALVPATLMLIAVDLSLYAISLREARADIGERGRLVAAALAEGSRYGVMSGNPAAIDRTVRGLMAADASIAAIEVADAARRPLVAVQGRPGLDGLQTFDAPIGAGALEVNLFDAPPAAAGAEAAPGTAARLSSGTAAAAPPLGFVRVVMSSAPVLQARRQRLYLGSALVLLAALASAGIGLLLARRLHQPLNAVMAALREIRQGRFAVRMGVPASGELGELQAAVAAMADSLAATHQRLEDQVAARTRELEQALKAIGDADAEKRRLIAHGIALVEDERRRISLEIHDDLNAVLVSVRLQAANLAAQAQAQGLPQLRQAAERIGEVVDGLYQRARHIVQRLRPEMLDTLGLDGAIEEVVRHYDEIHPDCVFAFAATGTPRFVPEPLAIAAYRVVQEALANVVKHAGASVCTVRLAWREDGSALELRVRDNGSGYNKVGAAQAGVGIIGMRERVSALAGSLAIESQPGRGTLVTVVLPLTAG